MKKIKSKAELLQSKAELLEKIKNTDTIISTGTTKNIYFSNLTGAVGIKPTSMVLETTVLPLNYAPIFGVIKNCLKPPKIIIT